MLKNESVTAFKDVTLMC